MRAIHFFLFCLTCALTCALLRPGQVEAYDDADAARPRLLKIVALSRHGVRSPTQHRDTLSLWSTRVWPHWPAQRGHLTRRGARLVTAMWEDLRGHMLNLGLLPDAVCPPQGTIFVRADTDQRTRATAQALLEALAPGCGQGYAVAHARPDPLFHPVKAGLYSFDPAQTATDVLSAAGGDLEHLYADYAGSLDLISRLSAPPSPELCARFNLPPQCRLGDIPTSVSVSPQGRGVSLQGGLGMASSLAEIFLLEYGQWPASPAGWGQVDARTLREVLPAHSRFFDVINRAPLVAWARGSALLTEMTAALEGTHYDQRLNAASLAVFVGHDTNIANVGGLLGVEWQARDYPLNGIPPAALLCLELWGQGDRREVRVSFYAQPLEALHAPFVAHDGHAAGRENGRIDAARRHAPVAAVVTAPPVVGEARFELGAFKKLVREKTAGAPLAPRQTPPLRLDSQASDSGENPL